MAGTQNKLCRRCKNCVRFNGLYLLCKNLDSEWYNQIIPKSHGCEKWKYGVPKNIMEEYMIKDSGDRTEFKGGAVRDIQKGKGACWLLPLKEVSEYMANDILRHIASYVETYEDEYIFKALAEFAHDNNWDVSTMILELSKHFEEGANKYGINNWTKGINAHCYIDSGIRHYLKWRRGDTDESHDRAFVWNMFCLLWTVHNMPEFNDLDKMAAVLPAPFVDKDEVIY